MKGTYLRKNNGRTFEEKLMKGGYFVHGGDEAESWHQTKKEAEEYLQSILNYKLKRK